MKAIFLKVGAFIFVASLTFGLVGCGAIGGDGSPSQDAPENMAEEVPDNNNSGDNTDLKPDGQTQQVIDAIDTLGEVSIDSASSIKEARDLYSALNQEQAEYVTNYDALVSAEETLSELEEAEELRKQTFKVGDSVNTDKWNITLTSAALTDTLTSSESRTCWEPSEGAVFLVLEFDMECLVSDGPTVDDSALTNIVATYGENTYKNWDMNYITSELWMPIYHTYFEANLPVHVYVYTQIPSAALEGNESVSVDLAVDGEKKHIEIG